MKTLQEYQPEMWTVRKDDMLAAIRAIEAGVEYTRAALLDTKAALGVEHPRNRRWAEQMERDIESMSNTLAMLRKYGPCVMPAAPANAPVSK